MTHDAVCATCNHSITQVGIDRNGEHFHFASCTNCGHKRWTIGGAEVDLASVLGSLENPPPAPATPAPNALELPDIDPELARLFTI